MVEDNLIDVNNASALELSVLADAKLSIVGERFLKGMVYGASILGAAFYLSVVSEYGISVEAAQVGIKGVFLGGMFGALGGGRYGVRVLKRRFPECEGFYF